VLLSGKELPFAMEKGCPDFHEEAIKYWTPYNTKVK
jgi:hypothetical protein